MIPQDEYIRIVLGLRTQIRGIKLLIGDLPLKMHERTNMCSKLHGMSNDIHRLYMDLKEHGLLE